MSTSVGMQCIVQPYIVQNSSQKKLLSCIQILTNHFFALYVRCYVEYCSIVDSDVL